MISGRAVYVGWVLKYYTILTISTGQLNSMSVHAAFSYVIWNQPVPRYILKRSGVKRIGVIISQTFYLHPIMCHNCKNKHNNHAFSIDI